MKIKTKQINIIFLIVLIILIGVIIYFRFYLLRQTKNIVETREQNYVLVQKINSVNNLNQKITQIDFYSKTFDEFYVDRENILKFINLVEQKAEEFKLELIIDNIDLDKTNIKEGEFSYGILNFNITAGGNFDNLNNYLKVLEKLPYFVDLTNIKMSLVEKDKWTMKVALKVLTN